MTVFDSRSVSPQEMLRVFVRRRPAMLGLFGCIVLGLSLYGFFWPPTYEATQRFLVKDDRDDPIVSPDQNTVVRTVTRMRVLEDDLNSEAAILLSEPVMRETVEQTRLHQAPVHWLLRLIDAPMGALRSTYNLWHNKPEADGVARAMERLARKTTVTPEKKSAILAVSVRWGDPRVALQLLQRITDNYLSQHLQAHKAPETAQFFQEQADRKRQELAEVERQIAAVRPGASFGGLQLELDLSLRNGAQAEAEWRKAKAAEAETEARLTSTSEQLRSIPERVVISERNVVNQASVGALKSRVLELQIRVSELSRQYVAGHRLVKAAEEELAEAQATLDREVANPLFERTTELSAIAESLQRDRSLAATALTASNVLSETLRHDVGALSRRSEQLKRDVLAMAELDREKRGIEDSLAIYLKRIEEARAMDAMNRMRIVGVVPVGPPAVAFTPVKPDAKKLFKLGLPLAILLAVGFGFALEVLDPGGRARAETAADEAAEPLSVAPRYDPISKAEG